MKLHQDPKSETYMEKESWKSLSENYRRVIHHFLCKRNRRGAIHSTCDLRFNAPNEIPVVLHNGSNYDYDFIIKELASESEQQF